MSQSQRPRKPIRSFVIREGRMTKGQQRAMVELWPLYGISIDQLNGNFVDMEEVFGRTAPVCFEIGFGDGGALLEMAARHPEINFIGVEVHRPGVGRVLLNLQERGLSNVRVFCEDGIDVLNQAIADHTLAGINLFFPDPWHKKKHHKRRILQPGFVELVKQKLEPEGIFHFATDWEPYAEEALDCLDNVSGLENCAGKNRFSDRPTDRPLTKFEQRGKRLGHGVWDIVMKKQA